MKKTKSVAPGAASRGAGLTPVGRRKRFIEILAQTANVTESAKQAGLDRSAMYRLREKSESFRAAWDEAMNQALDDLEATLLERAAHGVEKPVFYGGKACGTVRQYSDTLAMFLLRAKRPETYGKAAGPGEMPDVVADDPARAQETVHDRLSRIADRLAAGDGAADCGEGE